MTTDLLIIGAGPYGLAVAAQAKSNRLKFELLGNPMDAWREHMPDGMFLRSGARWHLDPLEKKTFQAFVAEHMLAPKEFTPIPRSLFLAYVRWFCDAYELEPRTQKVVLLTYSAGRFQAQLEDGGTVTATRVVICPGFRPFLNLEHPVAGRPGVLHTDHFTRFEQARGQRVIVVGGRQGAFEWAALLAEAGAREVHVVHRHPTPRFAPSDWDWLDPYMEQAERTPGWYAGLNDQQRQDLAKRFWDEGRLKLEPWLGPRLDRPEIQLWPEREVVDWDGQAATLEPEGTIAADRVVLATGFRMDIERLNYLCPETILSSIRTRNGYPCLKENFESSLPGLYFTSFASTQDFGPFFGFVRGCPATARILVNSLG